MKKALWGLATCVALAWPLECRAASSWTWTPTSLTGAPSPRIAHTAVWTGSKMIVWGGCDNGPGGCAAANYQATGGVYGPSTDTWTATSLSGAPLARIRHTAVWTGSRMIVWGGFVRGGPGITNTGGLYDPDTDTWSPMTVVNAPEPRYGHTAIWTGSQMIVWGGHRDLGSLDTGKLYDPQTDQWTDLPTTGAPSPRYEHTAVWTGSRMIVWGGYGDAGALKTGGIFDLATKTWKASSTINAPPLGLSGHTAVWTGQRMIVYRQGGGSYDPARDTWTLMEPGTPPYQPDSVSDHTATWNGFQMIVWGGSSSSLPRPDYSGAVWDPADTWRPLTLAGLATRSRHTAVWTGSKLIVWGGDAGNTGWTNSGGIYESHWQEPGPMAFHTFTPCRVGDTREPSIDPNHWGEVQPAVANSGRAFVVTGPGWCSLPVTAQAVALNVTVTGATDAGNLRLYPIGVPVPNASTLNYGPGQTRAASLVATLGDLGVLGVWVDQAGGHVHVILDVSGYFE